LLARSGIRTDKLESARQEDDPRRPNQPPSVKPTIKKAMDYEDYSGWDNDGDEEDAYEQDVRERLIEFLRKTKRRFSFRASWKLS
jgi:hypothetical protein